VFFIAHPPPLANHLGAPIATQGNIGGNDLPWQGQRQPQQCLRPWNLVLVG